MILLLFCFDLDESISHIIINNVLYNIVFVIIAVNSFQLTIFQ